MGRTDQQPTRAVSIAPRVQRFLIIALAFLVFLSGCRGGAKTRDVIPENTVPPAPVITISTPEPTREPTREMTQTATATLKPTVLPSRTATQEPTKFPTLPAETFRRSVIELLSTNGGCELPCWLGIEKGDAVDKVIALFARLGETPYMEWHAYDYSVSLDDFNFVDMDVKFYVDDNQIVQRIQVMLSEPVRFQEYHAVLEERFSLQSVLARYGKPSEVLFAAPPQIEPSSVRGYVLFVIYDEQDFGIVYDGVTGIEDPMRLCDLETINVGLGEIFLYAHEPRRNIPELNDSQFMELQPLEQVTNLTLEDFYQAFSSPNSSECIESPLEIWQ